MSQKSTISPIKKMLQYPLTKNKKDKNQLQKKAIKNQIFHAQPCVGSDCKTKRKKSMKS